MPTETYRDLIEVRDPEPTGAGGLMLQNNDKALADAISRTFADSSARAADAPKFIGQLALQLDTYVLYRASGTSAGNWVSVITNDSGVIVGPLIVRKDTLANLALITPSEGEIVYATDTDQWFGGDGTTAGGNMFLAVPSATGPIVASTTGNTRGNYAVDLSRVRASNANVASGAHAFTHGQDVLASAEYAWAHGRQVSSTGAGASAHGWIDRSTFNPTHQWLVASGSGAFAFGAYTPATTNSSSNLLTASGIGSHASGRLRSSVITASGHGAFVHVDAANDYGDSQAVASGNGAIILGHMTASDSTQRMTASGVGSFVAGYVDSGTLSATGTAGCIAMGGAAGSDVTSSGTGSIALGYNGILSSGQGSVAAGNGESLQVHTASNIGAVALGSGNLASGLYSTALGRRSKSELQGGVAQASGAFSATGDAQVRSLVLRVATTNATETEMTLTGGAASSTTRIVLESGKTYAFRVTVVGRKQSGGDTKMMQRYGLINNNGGTCALVGSVTTLGSDIESAANGWTTTITADDTNDSLKITVTGQSSTNIRWVAHVQLVEVLY